MSEPTRYTLFGDRLVPDKGGRFVEYAAHDRERAALLERAEKAERELERAEVATRICSSYDTDALANALIDARDRIEELEQELNDLHYDYLGADADRKHLEHEVVPKLKDERDELRKEINNWQAWFEDYRAIKKELDDKL